MQNLPHKSLRTFHLVMMAIISVDSLRNLPIAAQYGFSLIFFYLIAGLTFLLPLTWIVTQLTTKYPNSGSTYVWVENAFGKQAAYLAAWLQWLYNIVWYPTIFAFIAGTLARLIYPGLENNHWFLLTTCLSLYWLITFTHAYGVRISSLISIICAIIGCLLPMILMTGLAAIWLLSSEQSATPFNMAQLLGSHTPFNHLAYFSNILFSVLGLEIIAVYAKNVIQPEKTYPRAFFISAAIILMTLVFSSLALCIIIPAEKLSLLVGIMEVFELFFAKYHFSYGVTLIGWCIVVGGLGIASSWMLGLARGLHVMINNNAIFPILNKLNAHQAPINILLLQGAIYSLLLGIFLLFPAINTSYWILSALSAQFALVYYILLFAAGFKLLRAIKLNKFYSSLSFLLPITASLISVVGILVGFLPPDNIAKNNVFQYELVIITSFFAVCFLPFFVFRKKLNNIHNQ